MTYETASILYNGITLLKINIDPQDTLNEVLSKIDTAVGDIQAKQDLSVLDPGDLALDPLNITHQDFFQLLINTVNELRQDVDTLETNFSNLGNTLLSTVIPIDLKNLTGNNACVPASPVTLGQVLDLLVTQVNDIKKKDYSKDSCEEDCGVVTSVSGGFVACFTVPPAGAGDFDARDFFDKDFYAI